MTMKNNIKGSNLPLVFKASSKDEAKSMMSSLQKEMGRKLKRKIKTGIPLYGENDLLCAFFVGKKEGKKVVDRPLTGVLINW